MKINIKNPENVKGNKIPWEALKCSRDHDTGLKSIPATILKNN